MCRNRRNQEDIGDYYTGNTCRRCQTLKSLNENLTRTLLAMRQAKMLQKVRISFSKGGVLALTKRRQYDDLDINT